jgi:hypothetical protein
VTVAGLIMEVTVPAMKLLMCIYHPNYYLFIIKLVFVVALRNHFGAI